MHHANDNAPSVTPRLDTLFSVFTATAEPAARWIFEGWCAHIRGARHAHHVANSWAKHRNDFGPLYAHAEALTVARILDAGVPAEEITALLDARIRARVRAESKALPSNAS
jgi:hypothetical protein